MCIMDAHRVSVYRWLKLNVDSTRPGWKRKKRKKISGGRKR
jgi:hypothetical protein